MQGSNPDSTTEQHSLAGPYPGSYPHTYPKQFPSLSVGFFPLSAWDGVLNLHQGKPETN